MWPVQAREAAAVRGGAKTPVSSGAGGGSKTPVSSGAGGGSKTPISSGTSDQAARLARTQLAAAWAAAMTSACESGPLSFGDIPKL